MQTYKTRIAPTRATNGLRLMMRLYKSGEVTSSPEWAVLEHAVRELDRLYGLEMVAEHAWCTKDVSHLDSVFQETGDCLEWQKLEGENE